MMINMSMTASAEDLSKYYGKSSNPEKLEAFIFDLRDSYIDEKNLIQYTNELTKLEYSDCEYMVKECKNEKVDIFLLLGVLRRESNFNPVALGTSGERGLGQLMENTAKPVAENLGYVYHADKLFDTKFNLKLTITQLVYLNNIYNGDLHMALTAYNRGQQGLDDYMEKRSHAKNPGESEYSSKVLQFAGEYKEEFDKFNN
jgi:membrane-bound lytic murein transglycosylase MltF